MSHFLQSPAWERFQESLGRTVITDQGEGWHYLAILEKGRMNSRLYAPYGPVADSPEALALALQSMRAHAKALGAAFLRVEPTGSVDATALPSLGLRKTPSTQPEHTQRIRVDRPVDDVFAEMTKTLRNLHRNYASKGLSVRVSYEPDDIEHLIRLLGEVSERTGMRAHGANYFRSQASTLLPGRDAGVYLVELEGQVIAAALVYRDQSCCYYAHAAASTAHRKLHPGSILLTHMIEDACLGPQTEVDLFGVAPLADEHHPWAGLSKFKRTFGGYQVDYCGTWELPIKPVNYGLYSVARRMFGDRV